MTSTASASANSANPESASSAPETIEAVDAATGASLGAVPVTPVADVKGVVERARAAQRAWGALDIRERCVALRPVLELMIERRDALAASIARETGKPPFEGLVAEIFPTLELLDYSLRHAPEVLGAQKVRHRLLKSTSSELRYEPFGVVGLITPWNYPFFISAGVALSALVAGNAVVNKPSEFTPLVSFELQRLLQDAGLPKGLFQVVAGYGDVGAALIDAGVDRVSFTGSVATGRKVAAACGERLIPVTVELGGKDPAIILEGADLTRAVRALAWGAFTNSGQVCASVERIYVQESIADVFTERFVRKVEKLRQGVDVGAMNNRMQYEKVAAQVDEARARGAKILTGGRGTPGEGVKGGYFFRPTVIADPADDLQVVREETFGPVVTITRVADADEAVRRANDSEYGLTASVWTRDDAAAERIASQLCFGSVFINDHLVPSGAGEVPWGGTKNSGFGKTRGPHGLLEMSRVKHVSRECIGLKDLPVWYPYTPSKYKAISDMVPAIFGRSPVRRMTAGIKGLSSLLKMRS